VYTEHFLPVTRMTSFALDSDKDSHQNANASAM